MIRGFFWLIMLPFKIITFILKVMLLGFGFLLFRNKY